MPRIAETFDFSSNLELAATLIEVLAEGPVGVCLCDPDDVIRFVNRAFRESFFPDLVDEETDFIDAIAGAMRVGKGIKLRTMSVDEFIPRARARRGPTGKLSDFSADMADGQWFRVTEQRLASRWTLTVATEISAIKDEEFRLQAAHEQAVIISQTDFLTGLPNRRCGMSRLESEFKEFEGNRLPLTIALLDIDYFKHINDRHGHEIGDRVLIHFAQMLARHAQEPTHVSRIGGEEFLLVMPAISELRASVEIGAMMDELEPLAITWDQSPLTFTFSAGIASAGRSESMKSVMRRADGALYEAKAKGRRRAEIDVGLADCQRRGRSLRT